MDSDNANLILDVTLHETYGVSALSPSSERLKSHRQQWRVKDIPGLIAVALARGITILNESANSSLDRIDSAKGFSSTVRIFDLRPGYAPPGSKYREGQAVVSKHLSKGVFETETRRFDAFVREILMLSHPAITDHRNIVDLIAIGWEDSVDYESGLIWPVSIIECAPYGSVQDFLLSRRFEFTFKHLKALCSDIADAVAWLHACKIVHSDIKSENVIIIVSEEEREIPGFYFIAKLCDFGFALDTNALGEVGIENAWLDGYTPPWQPPEADEKIEISLLPAVDVYCFGMTVARIFMKGGDPLDICMCELSLPLRSNRQTLISQLHHLNAMPRQLTKRCLASDSYTESEGACLAELFQMTTATQSTARANMSQICEFLSVSPNISPINASPLELEEEHTGIPSIESCWALSFPQSIMKSIVMPLEATVQSRTGDDVNQVADVSQQEMAEAAYQLSLAYDIGFGVPVSQQSALENLLLSGIFGHIEARQEVFAVHAAYGVALPIQHKGVVKKWLYDAALAGDKVSADNLHELSLLSYYEYQERENRRLKLCERSGFVFDDDFWTSNDISDPEALVAAILDSEDPIDNDIGGGMTWLHVAAYGGSPRLASILINKLNHPLDIVNERGQTPLWIACLGGQRDVAILLLELGANASIASYFGLSTLHHLPAFDDGDVAIIASMLASNQADVNFKGPEGMTPLHYAIRGSGLSEVEPTVATLLDLGADPLLEDSDGETPLDAAIFLMRTHFVRQIMESESIRCLGREGRFKVLANAFKNFVGQLKRHRLRQGSSKYQERLMLIISLLCDNDIIEKYVLEDELGSSPLHDCYIHRSLDIAAAMLQIGVSSLVNMRTTKGHGTTPLLAAISKGLPRFELEKLINSGANCLITASTGASVLHYCVEYHTDIIEWICSLVEKQVGSAGLIDMLNSGTEKQGWTPLDYAVMCRDDKTASLLRSLGAKEANRKYKRQQPPHWNLVLDQIHDSMGHSQSDSSDK